MQLEEELIFQGAYYPSFYSIFINGNYDSELNNLDSISLGTFAHEFLHYVQNIDTISGLTNSQYYHVLINEVKEYINKQEKISLPIDVVNLISETSKRNKEQFDFNRGSGDNAFVVNHDKCEIKIDNREVLIKLLNEGKIVKENISFGSLCIKEGAALHFQRIFDENVNQPLTVPYLIIDSVCKEIYPELIAEPLKIIALAHLSLDSIDSGYTFIELLKQAKKLKGLTPKALYYSLRTNLTATLNGQPFH